MSHDPNLLAIFEVALLGAGAAHSLVDLRAFRFPDTAPSPYRGRSWREVILQSIGDTAATGLGLPWQVGRFLRRCYDEHLLEPGSAKLAFRDFTREPRQRPTLARRRLVLLEGPGRDQQ
jgi:hypothetical protein